MIFGNLFGKKPTASPAPSAPTVSAAPRLKGAFGRYFGEYSDGSTFFDRALAGAAIANGDYGAGATIRRDASARAKLTKAEQEKKRRESLYASPFANLYADQSGMAPQQQDEVMPRAGMTPNPSALSLDPIEPQFDAQGRQIEQVTVTGQRPMQAPQAQPAPFSPSSSQLVQAYRQKARLAAQEGDVDTFQTSMTMADTIEQNERKNNGSLIASQFAPIVGDMPSMAQMRNLNDPSGDVLANDERRSNDINDTIADLTRRGVQLSPTQIEGLRDPMTRTRVMNQLIAAGDPDKATQSALDVWKSRNEARPFQFENAGGSIIGLDPRTGRKVSEFGKSASPGERIQQQIARENNVSRQRIARIQASTTMSEGQKNRAIKQEQLNLERRKVELGLPQGAPLEPASDQQSSGIIWDDEE